MCSARLQPTAIDLHLLLALGPCIAAVDRNRVIRKGQARPGLHASPHCTCQLPGPDGLAIFCFIHSGRWLSEGLKWSRPWLALGVLTMQRPLLSNRALLMFLLWFNPLGPVSPKTDTQAKLLMMRFEFDRSQRAGGDDRRWRRTTWRLRLPHIYVHGDELGRVPLNYRLIVPFLSLGCATRQLML
jgi:hypothetical protein